jgi:hypothetical protein
MELNTNPTSHHIDPEILIHLEALRNIRLHIAATQLSNIVATADELKRRGMVEDMDDKILAAQLTTELTSKIENLRLRLNESHKIYDDEIDMLEDLLENDDDEITDG